MTTFTYTNMNPIVFEPTVAVSELTNHLMVGGNPLTLCNCDRIDVTNPGIGTGTVQIRIYDEGGQRMDGYEMGNAMMSHTTGANAYAYVDITITEGGVVEVPIYVKAAGTTVRPKAQVIIVRRPTP